MRGILRSPSWRVFLVVVAAALAWTIYSNQVWEDFYITYRASKNLAEGHGLTFTEGERVHSFTSPLGVLLPAMTYLAIGRSSDGVALWLFRFVCIAALGGAAVVFSRALKSVGSSAVPGTLLVAMLATDSKTLSFTTNGMETGILLLFISWAIWAVFSRPDRREIHLGLAWGGMMWTRPDACVYIAAMAVGILLFLPEGGGSFWSSRRQWIRCLVTAVAICAVVYLPWFVWAWWYYGSPVPHTIVAKGLFSDHSVRHFISKLVEFPRAPFLTGSTVRATFLPSYFTGGTVWPALVTIVTFIAALISLVALVIPGIRGELRFASFMFLCGQLYLSTMIGFPVPWYVPQVAIFAMMALALGFDAAMTGLATKQVSVGSGQRVVWRACAWSAVSVFLLVSGGVSVAMARQAFLEMRLVEYPVRQSIGTWLHDHAGSSRDTVFLEPLGYIGFYSGLKMYDFPGLSSPEMVAAIRRLDNRSYPYCWSELIRDLHPDWLVLRPFERDQILKRDPLIFDSLYELKATFDARESIGKARQVPVREFLDYNARFFVYGQSESSRGRPRADARGVELITVDKIVRKDAPTGINQAAGAIIANSPSLMAAKVPPGTGVVSGKFGFFAGVYANPPPNGTDGAGFRVEWVATDGSRVVLLQREMNPVASEADRGSQPFAVRLPPQATGEVEFIITPGATPNYDWTYWESLQFEPAP